VNRASAPSGAQLPDQFRALAIALLCALIALVASWRAAGQWSIAQWLSGLALTLPLWAPLPGIVRRNRRTYAWATLCVIPYFVLGVTEAIANPSARGWAAACLALALGLFADLIGYLRVTRPNPP
jgi:uncharacterized membrane protein